jgi:RNA polymerase sigma-70 factor, ECF subfamily
MAATEKCSDRAVERPDLHLVGDSASELVCRVADRDLVAFEALYRRYARPVFGMALRRLRDRGRAEDAVQETFTAVWRSAASYRPERGPGAPWLYAVARNARAAASHDWPRA